jgi:peptide/nickel transport system substrate-binding protein
MRRTNLTRRDFLRLSAGTATAALIVACQPAAAPTGGDGAPAAEEAVSSAAPAAGNVPRERTLIIGFEGEAVAAPEVANPYTPGSRINQGYHQAMIESLYYLNYQTGEAIPWLAAGPEQWNEDFTEVIIPIRDGVEWSDGQPFTAEDVAFTINMLRANPTLSYGATMETWVADATAVDELTCRITLTSPNPRFIYNDFTVRIWGAVRIVPKHIWENEDPNTFSNFDMDKGWPVWTGPYRLVKASPNEFAYDRRDDWWAAKTGFHELPAPERLVFVEAGPDEKKAATLAADEVDGHPSLRIDTFMDVKARNPNAIGWMADEPHAWIDPCPGMLGFNCQQAPWDDPEMRWAISYALDKQKIADAGSGGFGTPTPYNFPDYPALQSWLTENQDLIDQYDPRVYNPERAQEIFASKGYTRGNDGMLAKDGERLSVDILVKAESTVLPPLLIAMLQEAGIDAAPKALASAQYFDTRNRAQFAIETTHVACGSVVEPYGELNNLHSRWIRPEGEIRSNNYWGYQNAEYDSIVDQIASLPPNAPEEKELFRQALEIRLKDLPILPLSQQKRIVPYTTTYWTNWPTADNDYFHPPNWWMCFLMPLLNIRPTSA